ncbi:MAG: replicative DNA helicase [Candidatus Marinimicrobia bacterium]|jgi:replicative DNA helicase|nr:replicative DNA helicase [Candidatus Neomarinimicrobiota bacterium]MBT3796085.1 replicative DNA helicase [Candidatus Neomarinimicrobiota bacterium]MBT4318799.1 replicative DNA helicase [Candidatus Neomarinimicrobiota bacterium]MBT4785208.1 replicative DNA helicase [Candidatus Neomarinimicrobiota bacterium]MBT5096977.1 replicative DNA helicase [Candidatus Neomarinimicrobiota bacterium]|tara:strand:+ start:7075 stop:8442 length:1368 start_codon:yes stop_codon:yes gene_type:complete
MAKKDKINELTAQPQALEAELAVLGSMLLTKEAVSMSMQWLTANNFYKAANERIFACMVELFEKGEPVDAISVVDRLKKKKELASVGGAHYISGLAESVPTTANVEHYSKIVLEKHLLRTLIKVSHDVSKDAFEDSQDVDQILDSAESAIFNISEKRLRGGFKHIDPILHHAFEELDKIASKPGSVTGVPSGLMDLDDMTSGFHPGELIIVAGRPGMGKTALALTMGRNAAILEKTGVGMFSLEMANHQLAMRLLCAEGRVDSHLVRTGKLPKTQWKNLSIAVGSLAEAPIYLDDTPGMSVLEVRAKARRLKAEKDVGLIIVDYLQLMTGPKGSESRQQEISQISRSLKNLAKEIDLPVIGLSQLSRAVESRTDRRPQLSDLRESGAIEQDADVVIFLYRPWVYSQEEEDRGKAEIIVSKQRNGPTGIVEATFIDRFARFENMSAFVEMEAESQF